MSFFSKSLKFLKWIFGLIVLLSAVLVYNTLNFRPEVHSVDNVAPIAIDYQQAIERLSGALKFKTVSPQNIEERDIQSFLNFHSYLEEYFPLIHKNLSLTKINDLSLLYLWKSKTKSTHLKPIVIMGHFDVVPVDPTTIHDWTHPPFKGVIQDGNIWGRGALDDKSAVLAILEAVEFSLSQGFQPNRDIYFSFGHDEEVGGLQGAAKVVEYFIEKGITFDYVLDEGGLITEGMMPGVDSPIAFVGIAEKGYVSVKLSVQAEGGHSSMPPKSTSIGIVSQAIVNLEKQPFPGRLVSASESMLTTLGRNMPFAKRLVFANLWLFKPLLLQQLSHKRVTNAMTHTTMAATVFHAGDKENALPINASAIVNLRLLPGDTVDGVVHHINDAINDSRVKVKVLLGVEATPISSIKSDFFNQLKTIIHKVSAEKDLLVAPNLVVGGTDAKHFVDIADNVYRFNAVKINPKSFSGYHGTDEYLPVKEYQRAINFYYQLFQLNQ